MSQDERHELKFVLDAGRLAVAEQWLYQLTDLQRSYDTRWVNSIYFDDTGFSAVRDNLAGISDRQKIRLRWYCSEDGRDISQPILEIKSRKNRFGKKEAFAITGIQDNLLTLESGQFIPVIERDLANSEDHPEFFDDFLVPALHVAYQRDYFENEEGVRVTFDRNIHFSLPVPSKKILEGPRLAYPNVVMEVKFPDDLSYDVSRVIRALPLSVKRHSKYLSGLASFGLVVYN